MPVARIHINQHVIRRNLRDGTDDPPITVKSGGTNTYCRTVEVLGPSKLIYSPCKPLSCGARVWIETDAPLKLGGVEPR